MTLQWTVLKRVDPALFQQFTCARPHDRLPSGRRLPHQKAWEWEVQSHFRNLRSLPSTRSLLAGFDEGALTAVAELESNESADPPSVFILALAVHVDVRGQGGTVADQSMNKAIAHAKTWQPGAVLIYGKIHVLNQPSQALARRFGFVPLGLPIEQYQPWARPL